MIHSCMNQGKLCSSLDNETNNGIKPKMDPDMVSFISNLISLVFNYAS